MRFGLQDGPSNFLKKILFYEKKISFVPPLRVLLKGSVFGKWLRTNIKHPFFLCYLQKAYIS